MNFILFSSFSEITQFSSRELTFYIRMYNLYRKIFENFANNILTRICAPRNFLNMWDKSKLQNYNSKSQASASDA